MTNRQTLPELLGRISADRHAAELESLNRVIAEERARANRCRDEAVSLRDLLDDVIESLELLAPVPDEPQPESIPVAELAKVLGCDADAASVRQALKRTPPGGDREHWLRVDDAICALAHIAGVDPMQKRDVVLEKVQAAVVKRENKPKPDADGWYTHDGTAWPGCALTDDIVARFRDGNIWTYVAGSLTWYHAEGDYDILAWRHADGRDIKPGAPA